MALTVDETQQQTKGANTKTRRARVWAVGSGRVRNFGGSPGLGSQLS